MLAPTTQKGGHPKRGGDLIASLHKEEEEVGWSNDTLRRGGWLAQSQREEGGGWRASLNKEEEAGWFHHTERRRLANSITQAGGGWLASRHKEEEAAWFHYTERRRLADIIPSLKVTLS